MFASQEFKFLGFQITPEGVSLDSEVIQSILVLLEK